LIISPYLKRQDRVIKGRGIMNHDKSRGTVSSKVVM
jgi:hypothetical protein